MTTTHMSANAEAMLGDKAYIVATAGFRAATIGYKGSIRLLKANTPIGDKAAAENCTRRFRELKAAMVGLAGCSPASLPVLAAGAKAVRDYLDDEELADPASEHLDEEVDLLRAIVRHLGALMEGGDA